MKKGELVWDTLIPWLIAIGVLVLFFILALILSDKGMNILNYIKNILGFGT